MKHRVLLTQRFSETLLDRLREISPDLEIVQKSVPEQWDSVDTSSYFRGDEQVLYCFMPPRDLSVAPKLEWVQLHSAGINQLTDHPILSSNIQITTSSGIHAVPMGEFAIAMMLALARRIPQMVRMQDRGQWPKDRWRTFMGTELHGKTLGVIGYGSIGREVARTARQGFRMRVLALTRSGNKTDKGYVEAGVGDPTGELPAAWFHPAQLHALLSESDFVVVATPLTTETHKMIGESELRAMKPTAFLINIARGEIVDEDALVRALKDNWIAGAGLDVFAHEPLSTESELWRLENAILAPHISSATPNYDERAVRLFAENLRRLVDGEPLLNLVDKQLRY